MAWQARRSLARGGGDAVIAGFIGHRALRAGASFENCDVHPNAEGHAAIGAALAETILALEQATPRRGGTTGP